MTRALYLLDAGRLSGVEVGAELTLDGGEGHHAADVRRTAAGEVVDVADGDGSVATCQVVSAGRGELRLLVTHLRVVDEPAPRITLVQALAKGGRDELAIETATELGVDAVVPWQASRCVAVWQPGRVERGRQRWLASVRESAKQARRARVPRVGPLASTPDVAALVRAARLALVLHESALEPFADLPFADLSGVAGDVVLVVGPEGGLAAEELSELTDAGARAVRLGPEVLRTSTAGPAAVTLLAAGLGRWS